MKIKISEETVLKTTKCSKNFRCLSGENENLCRVVYFMSDKINFVKCLGDKDCPYLESHKKTELCNCPIRNEIYQRYKK